MRKDSDYMEMALGLAGNMAQGAAAYVTLDPATITAKPRPVPQMKKDEWI